MDEKVFIFSIVFEILLYLWCSIEIAKRKIKRNEIFWRNTDFIPIGDIPYYENPHPPKMFELDTFVFFPATIILGIYIIICKKVNS